MSECATYAQTRAPLRKMKWCIYRLYDGHNILLYIGISRHGISRLRTHCKQQSWAEEICFVDIQDCADSEELAHLKESEAIVAEKPKYNVHHVKIKSDMQVFVDGGEEEVSLTLCEAERISLASYYQMKKRGHAPVETRVPGSSLIRISPAARRQWHERLAALAQSDAARLEAERKRAQTIEAGKAAARSPKHVSAKRMAARRKQGGAR
jgi:hypothetical protein